MTTQREALQKILDADEDKLVDLAESIIEYGGLNPMDRMLVLKTETKPPRYTVVEGNRRTAALRLLTQPEQLSDLSLPSGLKKRFQELSGQFDRKTVEPLTVWELPDRSAANHWLRLRHTGENGGRGIIGWSTLQQKRFTGESPELQAIDFVRDHGKLSETEKAALEGRYITTVKRLLEVPRVRELIGVEIDGGRLTTRLPGPEVLKPLKRIVLDLAEKRKTVRDLMTVRQMVDYVNGFSKGELPSGPADKNAPSRALDVMEASEFRGMSARRRRERNPNDRPRLVPKQNKLVVSENRPAAIFRELRQLKLDDAPNAIAVLFRVFFELSIDCYMRKHKLPVDYKDKHGHTKWKTLDSKVQEVINDVVAKGGEKNMFNPLKTAISDAKSPLNLNLLNSYVHSSYGTPTEANLKAAWDHAQPLLEKIWP